MPYYPTIDEDLQRARQILDEGRSAGAIGGQGLEFCDGIIYGKDIYAAYQLLKSFVEEIDKFFGLFSDHEDPCQSFDQAEAIWNMLKARETKLHSEITKLEQESDDCGKGWGEALVLVRRLEQELVDSHHQILEQQARAERAERALNGKAR